MQLIQASSSACATNAVSRFMMGFRSLTGRAEESVACFGSRRRRPTAVASLPARPARSKGAAVQDGGHRQRGRALRGEAHNPTRMLLRAFASVAFDDVFVLSKVEKTTLFEPNTPERGEKN